MVSKSSTLVTLQRSENMAGGPWRAFFKGCILFPSLVRTAACAAR